MMRNHRARGSRRGGFSLVELMVAATILAIAISGISGAMVSSMALSRVNRETALASQSARRQMEIVTASVRGSSVPLAFAALSANPDFAVTGLDAINADPDGLPGQIQFPSVAVLGVPQLRENVNDASLGMPRDLDGDGIIDAGNHSLDAQVLPVRVRVQWQSVGGGTRTFDLETVLVQR